MGISQMSPFLLHLLCNMIWLKRSYPPTGYINIYLAEYMCIYIYILLNFSSKFHFLIFNEAQ